METKMNPHNKMEYPPMHTTEHILNQTMIQIFGCERSKNSHIERRKSKCDYILTTAPTPEQMQIVEDKVNEIIRQNLPITVSYTNINEVPECIDLSKLPQDVSQTLRLVSVGNYDICACIGEHINNTSEIGIFKIISYNFEDCKLRVRFKLV
ncbi:hypothetical protein [Bacteroides sp. 51]|uniref:hypothetical protein n=1 Tax=Bacteroides sp. 51 TaxID=2302938 RepID=UPI0013D6C785|nr:hypothetical protein [Bacteroides sp. 51]NDV83372.1 hypothetical protein [Bacteroides sp. 51]